MSGGLAVVSELEPLMQIGRGAGKEEEEEEEGCGLSSRHRVPKHAGGNHAAVLPLNLSTATRTLPETFLDGEAQPSTTTCVVHVLPFDHALPHRRQPSTSV